MRRKRGPYQVQRRAVIQPSDSSYRLIPLTQGQNAKVDAEDFARLSSWNWCAHWDPHTKSFSAMCNQNGRTVYMHRVVLECRQKEKCDHRSHDTLDNRKLNLRKCSDQQNNCNRRRRKDNTSGFKGVYLRGKLWRSRIFVHGKWIQIGYFNSKIKAARAYDEAAKIHHGEFAYANFASSPGG